ncbi:MAG: DNA-binding transcriptional regulator [Rhodobacterales bacterium]|nr:MAG: DNA-binding transcriptional regulator [Rhodobacterales bacterium]PIE06496.1 MAG: DNA-binding transcriptional regulator [Rhodobacterales bacterium]
MRRADRLFQIVQHLRGGRLVTAQTLAEELEVSTRTIYRDIADLIGSGVPVEGEAGVGYVMRQGFDLPPLMFTAEEVTALVAGARLTQLLGGIELANAAAEALVKIETILPETLRQRATAVPIHAIDFGNMSPEERARFDVIEAACRDHKRLRFDYIDAAGAHSQREVRPLGLHFWGRVWTLATWCELRDDFRSFRLDRMSALQTGATFRLEKGKTLQDLYARESACLK